jgi:hypothetical protein
VPSFNRHHHCHLPQQSGLSLLAAALTTGCFQMFFSVHGTRITTKHHTARDTQDTLRDIVTHYRQLLIMAIRKFIINIPWKKVLLAALFATIIDILDAVVKEFLLRKALVSMQSLHRRDIEARLTRDNPEHDWSTFCTQIIPTTLIIGFVTTLLEYA